MVYGPKSGGKSLIEAHGQQQETCTVCTRPRGWAELEGAMGGATREKNKQFTEANMHGAPAPLAQPTGAEPDRTARSAAEKPPEGKVQKGGGAHRRREPGPSTRYTPTNLLTLWSHTMGVNHRRPSSRVTRGTLANSAAPALWHAGRRYMGTKGLRWWMWWYSMLQGRQGKGGGGQEAGGAEKAQ